ncbi:acyltransferase [Alteraurantiacibacter aestuarii]|uniref:Acyltransferase family protein n=1 Tax=Alteraurantiacibacter aestuarii TaxID=650004 RepID=A0A844ZPA8_9SPHN|nr:acyltransferase [Alteraurantiacibacter aestuarii]MXO88860.1 acyltransferase family protein [Alteraurantiacibacter aestuarii]
MTGLAKPAGNSGATGLASRLFPPLAGAPGEIATIQYLRGFAAVLVLLYHLSQQWAPVGGIPALEVMRSGVDVFFVISGFVMVWSTDKGSRLSAGTFMARRIARVAPLYWVITSAVVLVLLLAPGAIGWTGTNIWHIIASYLFLPAVNPLIGAIYPVVPLGWTLLFEMFFYAMFALAILLGGRVPRRVMAILITSMLALVALGKAVALPVALAFYARPILLEFVFGVIVGLVFKGPILPGGARSHLPYYVIAFAGLFLLLFLPDMPNSWRALRFGIPSALMVYGFVHIQAAPSALWHRMGDMSYSLYLIHYPIVVAFGAAWHGAFSQYGLPAYALFMAAGTAISLIFGYLCWLLVELPLIDSARRRLRRPTAAPA